MTLPGAEASGLGMQRSFGPSQPETMGLAVGGFLCKKVHFLCPHHWWR